MAEYSKVGEIITTVKPSDAVRMMIALKREGFTTRITCRKKIFYILITGKEALHG